MWHPHLPSVPVLSRAPRPSRRFLAGGVLVAVLLVPGWFALRDSGLVRVDDVSVDGVSGPQAQQIRQALEAAARRMTTLHVDEQALADAVASFPVVASVTAEAHPPRRLDIAVVLHEAVAALAHGDERVAVAEDGSILEGTLTKGLPLVPVAAPPGGRRLAEPEALSMVALLADAPDELRERITGVDIGARGLVAEVADGPRLFFGPPFELPAKWAAATRVLADAAARGAEYLDVRVPERPAAGGLEPTNTQSPL